MDEIQHFMLCDVFEVDWFDWCTWQGQGHGFWWFAWPLMLIMYSLVVFQPQPLLIFFCQALHLNIFLRIPFGSHAVMLGCVQSYAWIDALQHNKLPASWVWLMRLTGNKGKCLFLPLEINHFVSVIKKKIYIYGLTAE